MKDLTSKNISARSLSFSSKREKFIKYSSNRSLQFIRIFSREINT